MSETLKVIKNIFAEVLITAESELDADAPYVSLGVDSILAVQIATLVESLAGVKVTVADIFNHVSIKELADFVDLRRGPGVDEGRNSAPHQVHAVGSPEKVAIVGIAGRFPGADSVEQYWDNLLSGKDGIAVSNRWPRVDGNEIKGGFLNNIESFDSSFFRISPKEAVCMDPQQRLLLEVSHHALEDCGLPLEALRERNCGVFATGLPGDYKNLLGDNPDVAFSNHSFLGNAFSSLSGRLSYFYNFNGPSITLDTACSSALTALHFAWLSIRGGVCDAALVGAVSVFSTPELFRLASRSGMISAAGRCAAFAEEADGLVPAEGCAAMLLMRLDDAQRQNLDIYGIVESILVNHDGLSNGLMAPNSRSQTKLIRKCYENAGINCADIAYVEAHGTGTKVGDPIEIQGLTDAYGGTKTSYNCVLGSSKTAIGHTLVCSGLASIFKVLLSFRHRTIPPHNHYRTPSQYVGLGNFKINREPVPWPEGKSLAAVSAFGFTGSNAHVVLRRIEEPPVDPAPPLYGPRIFAFSAHDESTLNSSLQQYLPFLAQLREHGLARLSFSLCCGLEHLNCRLAIVASTKQKLIAAISEFLRNGANSVDTFTNCRARVTPLLHSSTDRQDRGGSSELTQTAGIWAATGKGLTSPRDEPPLHRLKLPKYPFNRGRYWIGPEPAPQRQTAENGRSGATTEREVVQKLKRVLSDLLGYAEDQIDEHEPLSRYGVDSLTGIQLLQVYKDTVTNLSARDLFEYDSLAKLATYIVSRLTVGPCTNGDTGELPLLALTRSVAPAELSCLQWVQTRGQGSPMLLLPPLNTSYKAWMLQLKHLRSLGYQIHIPLYPGHSGNSFDARRFSYDAMVSDICDYITRVLKAPKVHMIGWSLGGCLSLSVSVHHSAILSSMTLVSTAASFPDELFDKTVELQNELLLHSDYFDIVFPGGGPLAERISAGASLNTLKPYFDALIRLDLNSQLSKITTKTLIVHGRQDSVIDKSDIDKLRHIPNAEFHEFERDGHFIPLTAPRRFNDVLSHFVGSGSTENRRMQ